MRKVDMVHYCPGDAIGTPAGLAYAVAEAILKQDIEYLNVMEDAGIMRAQCWPHIGGVCPRCAKPDRPAQKGN